MDHGWHDTSCSLDGDLHLLERAHNLHPEPHLVRLQGKDEANTNKTKFLSDLLAVVADCVGEDVECNVKQVLRGKDAEGANRLLQNLAKAAGVTDGADVVQVRGVEFGLLRTMSGAAPWSSLLLGVLLFGVTTGS